MKINAKIAGEIELDLDALPQPVLEQIKGALTVKNEDREKALQEKVFGSWDMPEWIELYRAEERRGGERVLCLPRGFAQNLFMGVTAMGHEVEWDDQRTSYPASDGYYVPFTLRPYQLDAVLAMLRAEQGFYEAPAGSGKTTTMLGAFAYANQRTLVIVDKAGLVEQWRARAAQFLGLSTDLSQERSVGKIGEGVWEERDLTICLRQTLWARVWELDATDWMAKWGYVLFDEGHHLSADTLAEVCRRCTARLLQGTSATPAKTETQGRVVHSMVGPVVHKTERDVLYQAGVLMRPTVEVVYTGHDDVFWDTHESDADGVCKVPDCKKAAKGEAHFHRNNYSSCLKKLVESKARNAMIARRIVSDRGHVHLVASRQLKHLDILRKAVEEAGWDGPIYMLRGAENAEGLSQHIAESVIFGGQWEMISYEDSDGKDSEVWRQTTPVGEHGREAVIFSTVADEALDIPPIDRVHVAFPMRQQAATIQLVGRGERVAEGKVDAVIVDYRDRCDVFAQQGEVRDQTFRYVGYEIKEVNSV